MRSRFSIILSEYSHLATANPTAGKCLESVPSLFKPSHTKQWRACHSSTTSSFHLTSNSICSYWRTVSGTYPRLLRTPWEMVRILVMRPRRVSNAVFSDFSSHGRRWRSQFQQLTPNDVVLGLIIANSAVYFLWRIADERFMTNNFTISVDNVLKGRLHTLVTYAFSHVHIGHFVSCMIGLYFFGTNIAAQFGPHYLLKVYLAGALCGSAFHLLHRAYAMSSWKRNGTWWNNPSSTPALGANAAVNSILLLHIFLNPRSTIYFHFFIPVPAMFVGCFLIAEDLLRMVQGDKTIGVTPLGGVLVAALEWYRFKKRFF